MSLRALIVVTHLLGAGHLMRAAALARAFGRAGHDVTLISGGRPVNLVDTTGFRLVQLPPVRALPEDLSTIRDAAGRPADEAYLDRRRDILMTTLAATRPDVIVTELYPFGRRKLAAEFHAVLDAAQAFGTPPLIVSSIRDILAEGHKAANVVRANDIVGRHYDAVLVHGDGALLTLDASWPVDDVLRPRLIYTGYVDAFEGVSRPPARGSREILVSGGSSSTGVPLYRAALASAAADPSYLWRIMVGPGVDDADRRELRSLAPSNAIVEDARPDFRDLMANAAVFVGQAGYNTIMDVLASQVRAVLVPFERGRETEQRMRADVLVGRGLARLLPETELTPARLSAAVVDALDLQPRRVDGLKVDGASESVRQIERLAASRQAGLRRVAQAST